MKTFGFLLSVLVWAFLASEISAKDLTGPFGRCPTLPTVKDFDISRMQGVWFIGYQFTRGFSDCHKFNMTATSEYSMTINSTVRATKGLDVMMGAKVTTPNNSKPGVLRWSWDLLATGGEEVTIVDTDYDNYCILVFCSSFGFVHHKYAVIFTRKDDLVDTYINRGCRYIEGCLIQPYFPHESRSADVNSDTEIQEYINKAKNILSPYMRLALMPLSHCDLNKNFPRNETTVKTLDTQFTLKGIADFFSTFYT